MLNILNFLKPNKPTHSTIDIYGHISSGVDKEQIQLLMKWLFDSLINAGYFGKSHLIFYNNNSSDRSLESVVKKVMRGDEPVFLYRYLTGVYSPCLVGFL